MNSQVLAEKIFQDIQSGQVTTISILQSARALGKLLKISDFDWVENELNGYDDPYVPVPQYRTVDAMDNKTWSGNMPPTLSYANSDWLGSTNWIKWKLGQPVSVLEDLVPTGIQIKTGTLLKTLELGYASKNVFQEIDILPREIKRILVAIQDKVQSQVADYLAKPKLSKPSLTIFSIFSEFFPEILNDINIVAKYLEDGDDYVSAARSVRSVLHLLINKLVISNKPKNYVYADGIKLNEFGEKSKMKYYLEMKGTSLFKNKQVLLDLDKDFRDIYDIGSKALKGKVNIYEANFCIDGLIRFLEQLYKYSDLKPI